MATNPKEMAEIVRRLSAKNAPKDTVLAAITPKEAAILKARGGSGKVDPVTGVKHFEENDDNAGYNDDGSWNDSSKRDTEGGKADRIAAAQQARDDAMNAMGKAAGAESTEGTYKTGYSATIEHKGTFGRIVAAARALFSGLATIGNASTGNSIGAALSGYDAYKNAKIAMDGTKVTVHSGAAATSKPSGPPSTASDSGNTGLPGSEPGPVTTSESNTRNGSTVAAAKSLTDISKGLLGGTTPTFDYFQAIARSKQGQKSTVLGGGTGSAPTSTSLLGV